MFLGMGDFERPKTASKYFGPDDFKPMKVDNIDEDDDDDMEEPNY